MPQFKQNNQKKRQKIAKKTASLTTEIHSSTITSHSSKKTFQFTTLLLKSFITLVVLLVATAVLASGYIYSKAQEFETISTTSISSLIKAAIRARNTDLFADKNEITLMILGLDSTQVRETSMMMTDTIMLIKLKQNGDTTLLALPRDLWIDTLKTKINALYYYGQESDETTGVELLSKVIFDLTGLPLDHYLVIDIDHLREIIDAVGGVDVLVDRSFIDTKYPSESPIDSETSSEFQTISFSQGQHHFDGARAMQFMRSRQSEDLIEGTDQARSKRQQKVIQALVNKLGSNPSVMNPKNLGMLLALWNKLDTNIDLQTIFAIGLHSLHSPISFNPISIPVADKQNTGIITNPPVSKHGQWVWEPVDPTWNEFKLWISQHF